MCTSAFLSRNSPNQNSNSPQASVDGGCSTAYGRPRGSKDQVDLAPTLTVWRAPCILLTSPAVCILCSCRSAASSLLLPARGQDRGLKKCWCRQRDAGARVREGCRRRRRSAHRIYTHTMNTVAAMAMSKARTALTQYGDASTHGILRGERRRRGTKSLAGRAGRAGRGVGLPLRANLSRERGRGRRRETHLARKKECGGDGAFSDLAVRVTPPAPRRLVAQDRARVSIPRRRGLHRASRAEINRVGGSQPADPELAVYHYSPSTSGYRRPVSRKYDQSPQQRLRRAPAP